MLKAFEEDMGKDKTPKASARLRKAAAAFIAYLLDMLGEVPPAGSAFILQTAGQLDSGTVSTVWLSRGQLEAVETR